MWRKCSKKILQDWWSIAGREGKMEESWGGVGGGDI